MTRLSLLIALYFLIVVGALAQNPRPPGRRDETGDPERICPRIRVSCPAELKDDEPIIYTASVEGGNPDVVLSFEWTVFGGKIISGQGTSSITVSKAGVTDNSFTGSVRVGGLDSSCSAGASCSTILEHWDLTPKKFGSYGSLPVSKENSRLDAFAVQLRNEPGTEGYILVYGGRRGRAGEAQKTAERSKSYLVKTGGIDAARIVTIDGGYKETLTIDLWIVQTGAVRPAPQPTVDPSEVTMIGTVKKKRSKQ